MCFHISSLIQLIVSFRSVGFFGGSRETKKERNWLVVDCVCVGLNPSGGRRVLCSSFMKRQPTLMLWQMTLKPLSGELPGNSAVLSRHAHMFAYVTRFNSATSEATISVPI